MLSSESSQTSNFVKAVFEGAGIELLLFFLAFFAHLCIFSEHGVLHRKKKATENTHPEKEGRFDKSAASLTVKLRSLMQAAPHAKIDLALKGSESDDEVKELLSANEDVLMATVQAALDMNNKDVLRCFLTSLTSSADGDSTMRALMDGLASKGLVKEALDCINLLKGACKIRCWLFICKSLIHRKNADGLTRAISHCNCGSESSARWQFHVLLESAHRDHTMLWIVFDAMKAKGSSPDNSTCKILMKSIERGSSEDHVRKVWKVLEDRQDSDVDDNLMTAMHEACARSNQQHIMCSYLQKLDDNGAGLKLRGDHRKSAHSVSVTIRALSSVGDIDGAWKEWHAMKQQGQKLTHVTLGCMVEALASNDDPEAAYGIIREALADPATQSIVNAVVYSSVIKSFNKQKRFDRVWSLYNEMVEQSIKFSVTTFNVLLDACARSSDLGRAEPLLEDMLKQGIQPNLITYGTIVKVYCAECHFDQAFAVMEEMPKAGVVPDEVIYNTILDGCARIGDFDRGMVVLQRMQDAGLHPSNFTLSVAAKLANRSRKPEKAFEVVEKLKRKNGNSFKLNIYVYNNLIKAASMMGDIEKAQEVFAIMLKERVRPIGRTYALLLETCINQEAASAAVTLLLLALGLQLGQDSHAWHKQQHDVTPLIPLLSVALKSLPQQAWAAAPKRGADQMRHDTVIDTFGFLCRTTHLPRSVQLNDLWREVQKAMPGLKPDTRIRAWLSQQ